TAAGDPEHQGREAERAQDEIAFEVDALYRRVRQQGQLGFPETAPDRDLFAQAGPAVEARAERRRGTDEDAEHRPEPAERLPERHRDQPADARAQRADQPAECDNAVALLPYGVALGARNRDFGQHRID